MKKIILLFVTAISLIACNDDSKLVATPTTSDMTKSKAYFEIIKYAGGDFAGFNLGEKIETASKVFNKENLVESESDYLFYKFEETYTNSEYQLSFSENKLKEIYLDTYIYDETGTFDRAASALLFNEIKEDFLKRFGNKYMETIDEQNEILYWSNDKKNIQLIHEVSKAAIHVYLDISDFEE
jgi:hypothetical protein